MITCLRDLIKKPIVNYIIGATCEKPVSTNAGGLVESHLYNFLFKMGRIAISSRYT